MVTSSSPVFIRNSEARTLYSKSVDQEYRILVALPINYAESNDKYPVLYVLDPGFLFGWITDMVRTAALLRAAELRFPDFDPPNLIVVGIDYPPTSGSALLSLRARDYSPTKSPDYKKWPGTPSGGAKKFLRFIRDELMPNINSSYRTDPTDSTIVGHSFGGLFVLYVLFHEPDAFRRYVASSPPLSYDNKVLFEYEREYASKHTELPAKLFLSVGSLVESEGSNAVPNLKELVEILAQRKYKGLELESHIFEDEGHMCVIGTAICRGISSVFSKPNAKQT